MPISEGDPIHSNDYSTVADVIERRRTWKVLSDPISPRVLPDELCDRLDPLVLDAIVQSGWAPFHYSRNHEGVAVPWRFHIVNSVTCRKLAGKLPDWFQDINPNNKLPAMLSACGALVLVYWLPQFDEETAKQKQVQINEEHLAAASCAVQNLLLLLTAAGLGTYWSSGGFFRTAEMSEKLGIDPGEKLLAAVFVDYLPEEAAEGVERIGGKHRESRSPHSKWISKVDALND